MGLCQLREGALPPWVLWGTRLCPVGWGGPWLVGIEHCQTLDWPLPGGPGAWLGLGALGSMRVPRPQCDTSPLLSSPQSRWRMEPVNGAMGGSALGGAARCWFWG